MDIGLVSLFSVSWTVPLRNIYVARRDTYRQGTPLGIPNDKFAAQTRITFVQVVTGHTTLSLTL